MCASSFLHQLQDHISPIETENQTSPAFLGDCYPIVHIVANFNLSFYPKRNIL